MMEPDTLVIAVLAAVIFISFLLFVRLIRGTTTFDRLLASGAVGTNTVLILILTGYVFNRPDMFVDLALTYALLNFIGTVAIGKYLETHKED